MTRDPALAAQEGERVGAGLACSGCGLSYSDPGWCDAVIPTDVWVQISPRGDCGGVLCLTCMARALVARGIENVPMKITSGPWVFEDVGLANVKAEVLRAAAEELPSKATGQMSYAGHARRWLRDRAAHIAAGERL